MPVNLDMASKKLISSGSPFEAQIGYSRAVVMDDWVFVSGCTGYADHIVPLEQTSLLPCVLSAMTTRLVSSQMI
jgi:enamine deaminase RidA (YjgF/YER057c/UK114 family)